jgi:hypothetical protein
MIHDIYLAASREEAETAWKKFISAYCAKYPKAAECSYNRSCQDKYNLINYIIGRMGKSDPKLKPGLRTRARTHPLDNDYERMS